MSTLRELLAERIRLEKEHPLAPEDANTWHQELVGNLNGILDRTAARMYREIEADAQHFIVGGPEWFVTQASDQIKTLRAEYLREADLMKAERDHVAKVPPAVPPAANIVLNITHSQLVGLNIAGVVGSLQASLTTIQTGGGQGIAEALKSLAEAIAGDEALSDRAKAESLAHVSAMGEEFAKPASQQRGSILQTLAGGLVTLISHADKVYAAYEILKTTARAGGYELP